MSDPLPTWPDFAFRFEPLNDSLEQDAPNPSLRSDFEQGMARQRRIFRNAPTTFICQWAMTPSQLKLFKGFVNTVRGGTFTVPVFSDADYVTVTAQFVEGSLKYTRSGGEWLVAATIETMDKLEPSPDEYVVSLLLFGTAETIDTFISTFHTAVQTGLEGALA